VLLDKVLVLVELIILRLQERLLPVELDLLGGLLRLPLAASCSSRHGLAACLLPFLVWIALPKGLRTKGGGRSKEGRSRRPALERGAAGGATSAAQAERPARTTRTSCRLAASAVCR
jgi:hypothetical protein